MKNKKMILIFSLILLISCAGIWRYHSFRNYNLTNHLQYQAKGLIVCKEYKDETSYNSKFKEKTFFTNNGKVYRYVIATQKDLYCIK